MALKEAWQKGFEGGTVQRAVLIESLNGLSLPMENNISLKEYLTKFIEIKAREYLSSEKGSKEKLKKSLRTLGNTM
jgi:hypothetical protein